jgi:hypothetical protein
MALPSAVCTVQDGSATAVSAASAGVQVTPGNLVTVALNSSTSVNSWTLKVRYTDDPLLLGLGFSNLQNQTTYTFQAPNQPFQLFFDSEVTDTFNAYTSAVQISGGFPQVFQPLKARNVLVTNQVVNTAGSYTVTTSTINDNVSGGNVAGDVVLAVAQTSVKQNGLYVVGAVTSSTAALTRAPGFATGTILSPSQTVDVSEGTLFTNTTWKCSNAGPVTVDTTSTTWFPRYVAQQITLVAGLLQVSNVPILSSTKTTFTWERTTPTGTASTVMYNAVTITAGALGAVACSAQAQVAAGTVNVADSSVLNFGILQQF